MSQQAVSSSRPEKKHVFFHNGQFLNTGSLPGKLFKMRLLLAVFLTLILFPVCRLSAGPAFFEKGKTSWGVDTGNSRNETVLYAAKELKDALRKISGTDFPSSGTAKHRIILKVDSSMPPDQVSIRTADGNLLLSGGSERSVLYAAYTFLQKYLGVRWLWPGPDGEFIPKKNVWNLPDIDYNYKPALKYRGFHMCGGWHKQAFKMFPTWMARNFINIERHGVKCKFQVERGFHIMFSGHNVDISRSYYKTQPEMFAEINGKRIKTAPCLSNEKAFNIIYNKLVEKSIKPRGLEILGLMAPDSPDYCRCDKCRHKTPSTLWFDFYNRLTDKLKKQFPNLKFNTIAYQWYRDVPTCRIRNTEFIELCLYDRCNIHKFGTGCPRNARARKIMSKWEKTGLPLGNYGYEFDVVNDNIVLPFYSFIADTIREEVRRKHIAMITEINLGPRKCTEEELWIRKNRLGIYLYAQLMWNPDAGCDTLIRDWCQTVYGKAAEPMYRYYKLLDTQWSGMKMHHGILGRAANIAPNFITPELQSKVAKLFTEASIQLGGKKNKNLEYEKFLISNWQSVKVPEHLIILPSFSGSSPAESEQIPGCSAKIAWNSEGFYLSNAKFPCEIMLNLGFGGEQMFFIVDASGNKKSWRISNVGVKEDNWAPEWKVKGSDIIIPFKSIGGSPLPSSSWKMKFSEAGRTYPSGKNAGAVIKFSNRNSIGKSVLWWNGIKTHDVKYCKNIDIAKKFTNIGWKFKFANLNMLETQKPDIYWFRNPGANSQITDVQWTKIRENVKNGAVAFFFSYMGLPLEKYFADPTFAVKLRGIGKTTFSDRHVVDYVKGSWISKPNDMSRQYRNSLTPAYYLIPQYPEYWKILVRMPKSTAEKMPGVPMLMMRKYGKGYVIVLAANPVWYNLVMLSENIFVNRSELGKDIKMPSDK